MELVKKIFGSSVCPECGADFKLIKSSNNTNQFSLTWKCSKSYDDIIYTKEYHEKFDNFIQQLKTTGMTANAIRNTLPKKEINGITACHLVGKKLLDDSFIIERKIIINENKYVICSSFENYFKKIQNYIYIENQINKLIDLPNDITKLPSDKLIDKIQKYLLLK